MVEFEHKNKFIFISVSEFYIVQPLWIVAFKILLCTDSLTKLFLWYVLFYITVK